MRTEARKARRGGFGQNQHILLMTWIFTFAVGFLFYHTQGGFKTVGVVLMVVAGLGLAIVIPSLIIIFRENRRQAKNQSGQKSSTDTLHKQ